MSAEVVHGEQHPAPRPFFLYGETPKIISWYVVRGTTL
jgi:hypothetical protein